MSESLQVYPFPATVLAASQDVLRARAVERRAVDADALEGEQPFFFSAEISNNKLDSYYTRMTQSTLRNYAEDAGRGVSFLYSHDNSEIIGRSTDGRFVGGQGNGVARVEADFFAVPGLQLGSVQSDQVIRALKLGVIRDVSVGFYGGELLCSICGRDIMRDWECRHYPGFKYEVEHDGRTEEVVCTADVENARLAEVSGVYKGSTPGAVVLKAERDAEEGRIKPEVRTLIEQRYRIHLPGKRTVVPGAGEGTMGQRSADPNDGTQNPPPPAENPPNDTGNPPPADPPADPPSDPPADGEEREVAQLLTRAAVANPNVKTFQSLARVLTSECERLKPLADDGTRYRDRLRECVIQEQIRATGKASESFRGMVSRATVGELEGQLNDLGVKGYEVFGHGRSTTDGTDLPDEPGQQQTRTADVPPAYTAAYSAS